MGKNTSKYIVKPRKSANLRRFTLRSLIIWRPFLNGKLLKRRHLFFLAYMIPALNKPEGKCYFCKTRNILTCELLNSILPSSDEYMRVDIRCRCIHFTKETRWEKTQASILLSQGRAQIYDDLLYAA